MNQHLHFGVTRFANGQYLVQSAHIARKTGANRCSDDLPKRIGIYPTLAQANAAYMRWLNNE